MSRTRLRYWLAVTAVVAAVLAYAGHRNLRQCFQDHLKSEAEIQAKLRECEALEQRIQASRERVESLGSDPLEIEADIRRNKNLVREGEKVYRIETVSGDDASPDDSADAGQ